MTQTNTDIGADRMVDALFRGSEATRRPPSATFQCSESTGTGKAEKGRVTFRCTISNQDCQNAVTKGSFIFHCREPSFGVLTNKEPAAVSPKIAHEGDNSNGVKDDTIQNDNNDELENDNYDNFFLIGTAETYPYALAKKTGFQIWPGTRILVDSLLIPRPGDHGRLRYWQHELQQKPSINILELGAGVGVVGTVLAGVRGAHVLLTDLELVVNDSLIPNLLGQHEAESDNNPCTSAECPPTWLSTLSLDNQPVRMGHGWAAATQLDWTQPLTSQLSHQQQEQIDLIIAGDCCFLSSMLHGLFDTVAAIFEASRRKEANNNNDIGNGNMRSSPRLLLSLQRRDPEFFTSIEYLLDQVKARSWTYECLAWYPVVKEVELVEQEESSRCCNTSSNSNSTNAMKEVFLFEVSPAT